MQGSWALDFRKAVSLGVKERQGGHHDCVISAVLGGVELNRG